MGYVTANREAALLPGPSLIHSEIAGIEGNSRSKKGSGLRINTAGGMPFRFNTFLFRFPIAARIVCQFD
ncbi:hypothetical protein CPSG_06011 [Coccidioides posadasii str. Silveira]|uniref:Uncharacterized protein n=1 Tax=Coccidioides posadasii (strain RMSCC 757 / Silveira) TaxID=443226 RepID=E9D859_COCPS|nr:hypothetical protein CPSG_06011 [Coccidioides posadasii str. Silveira]